MARERFLDVMILAQQCIRKGLLVKKKQIAHKASVVLACAHHGKPMRKHANIELEFVNKISQIKKLRVFSPGCKEPVCGFNAR